MNIFAPGNFGSVKTCSVKLQTDKGKIMDEIQSARQVREFMASRGVRFNKGLGQNFLIDDSVLEEILNASEIGPDTCVLEIGPGIGVLTRELARQAEKVVSVEIDTKLIPLLEENVSEFQNIKIINQDFLKLDLQRLFQEEFQGKKVKVIANLPYYVTTPIIMKLLEEKPGLESIVIMIQKEVAERLTARPGSKQYGAITLAIQYYCVPQMICLVPPESFVPQPKVWSAVLRLDILKQPPVQVASEIHLFQLIKASFGQRRKTFINSVGNYPAFGTCKEDIKKVLKKLGYSENLRGETLDLVQFAQLSDEIFGINLYK